MLKCGRANSSAETIDSETVAAFDYRLFFVISDFQWEKLGIPALELEAVSLTAS